MLICKKAGKAKICKLQSPLVVYKKICTWQLQRMNRSFLVHVHMQYQPKNSEYLLQWDLLYHDAVLCLHDNSGAPSKVVSYSTEVQNKCHLSAVSPVTKYIYRLRRITVPWSVEQKISKHNEQDQLNHDPCTQRPCRYHLYIYCLSAASTQSHFKINNENVIKSVHHNMKSAR